MIIDFRVQPPFKSFLDIYFYRQRPAVQDPVKVNAFSIGRRESPSYVDRSIELFVREMDEAKIDLAVIMGQRAGKAWGSVSNDDIGELLRRYPDQFAGFAGIDPHDAGASGEIRRSVEELGCCGVSVLPGWSDPPLHDDDRIVYPIYETAAALEVPVMITSSHVIGPDMSYAMPEYIQRVALDFPQLTIIVGHACWPWTTQACALGMRCTNVYLMPEIYMHVADIPGAGDYVGAANSYLSHRMLYSSCFPTRSLEQALEDFRRLPIKPESQELMLWQNGARVLGLEDPGA
jgi:predicted TIM-barrel fold metal-dependent hydrolase